MPIRVKHLVKSIAILIIGLTLQTHVNGQIVNNGTFLGDLGAVSIPFGWESCLSTSTVDIQPGAFAVAHSPIDGGTYLGMACRALDAPSNPGTCEEINQPLNEELIAGTCYQVEVYLARSLELSAVAFRNPIDLDISVGNAECETKLEIVHFGPIEHTEWRKYTGIFTPSENMSHLWLKGVYSSLPEYSGYLLMDNIVITEAVTPALTELEICRGSSVNLTAHIDNAESYLWNTGETTKTIEAMEEGDYFVDITNAGCTLRKNYRVNMKPSPTGEINTQIGVCIGESVRIDMFEEGASYFWQNGSTESFFVTDTPGTYSVIVRLGDCNLTKTVTVFEKDRPVFNLPENITLCGNEQLRLDVAQDNATYLWQDGSTDSYFDLVDPGIYSVQITLNGCTEERSVNVVRGTNPIINLESTNLICPGDRIRLDAFQSGATYLWQDGSTEPVFIIEEPGSYSVQVSLNECTSEQIIEVLRGECEAILEMPNAFSPNNDGKNDLFTPIQSIRIPRMQTLIFNRWGHQIFSTSNLNIEWNGNLPNGDKAPPTTYYWSIQYADLDGFLHNQKGTVNLIR